MLKKEPTNIIFCGMILFLIIIFLGKHAFVLDGSFMGGIDIPAYLYWNVEFVKERLLSGSFPFWNPYILSGHPFFANPSTFVLYPATLLYVFLPLPWAFNIDILIHIYIAAIGMYFFVKMITQSRYAGLAAAIVFSLNGYFMWRIYNGHITLIHAAALIPFIFYYIEKAVISNRIFFLSISGLILGIQILGGDPQITYYTSLFLTLYFFIRWFSVSKPLQFTSVMRAFGFYIIIPLVALGISAIQIVPTMEFRSLSSRSMNTYEYATFMSFNPLYLFHYIAPYFTSPSIRITPEFGCYVGILSIILAGIGGAFSRHRKYSIPIIIMLIIALTFMLGSTTPIYYLYYKFLPMLSTFRVPARCLVIFDFLMSILVGFGLQHLCEFGLKKYQRLSAIAVLIIISICMVVAISAYQNYGVILLNVPLSSTSIGYALLFTFLGFVIISTFQFIHNKHIVAGLFITMLFLDLYLVCSPLIPELKEKDFAQEKNFEHVFESDNSFFRVNIPGFGPSVFENPIYGLPNHAIKFHYYGINGSTPFMLKEYSDFIYGMADIPESEQHRHSFMEALFHPDKVFSSKILGVKYANAVTPSGFQLLTAKEFQPRASLIRNLIFSHSFEDHLGILKRPDFNPRKTVLLEDSARDYFSSWEVHPDSSDKDKATIDIYSPNRIELRSYSPSNTVLLLSELYYPGWKAYVDGKDVPILRADYLLRAVKLNAGQHSITIVYRPMSFYIGSIITIFTILLLILTYLFLRRKNTISEELPQSEV
jgi:hypothetical protein